MEVLAKEARLFLDPDGFWPPGREAQLKELSRGADLLRSAKRIDLGEGELP